VSAFTVAYADDHLLVVDKGPGVVVHPGRGHAHDTLSQLLASSAAGGDPERAGIVHRLDRDTSGLMVVARNDAAHRELARQLQQRVMTRRYRAIVVGEVADLAARIEAPIGRDRKNRQRMAVVAGGREAVTEFRRLAIAGGHSLLDVSLGTGRTHQIRVHLAHLGHPLMGDAVYGPHFKTKAGHLGPRSQEALVALGRQALHAYLLTLKHPETGAILQWISDLPADLTLLKECLRATQ
jgi:23S rRNA pseudouridine1911/1915/1917 synthase